MAKQEVNIGVVEITLCYMGGREPLQNCTVLCFHSKYFPDG